jgi:hypothetical protein
MANSTTPTATVTDARGRIIEIRKIKPLDRMQLMEIIGPDNSANDRYLGYATLAYCVTKIDKEPVGRLGSKLALEALVQELDDDGMNAVGKGMEEHFIPKDESKDAVKNA